MEEDEGEGDKASRGTVSTEKKKEWPTYFKQES
jgi:hypothetical protein